MDTDSFIKASIEVYGMAKYVYDITVYKNTHTKVQIYCVEHDKAFSQIPHSHLKGQLGCKQCITYQKCLTTDEFIKKAQMVHGDRYLYNHVDYINTRTKVVIECRLHGLWSQKPNLHILGHNCRECSREVTKNKNSIDNEEFIKKCQLVHGDRYLYHKVNYINKRTKVDIICHEHGVFHTIPTHFTRGTGCAKCANTQRGLINRSDTTEFIKKSILKFGDRYTYPYTEYITCGTPVIITCKEHGNITIIPADFLSGNGCGKCGRQNSGNRTGYNTEIFIELAVKKYGKRFLFNKVEYIDSRTPVIIICSNNHEFTVPPSDFLTGRRSCVKCNMCPSCLLFHTMGQLCQYCKPPENNKLYKKMYVKSKEFDVLRFMQERLPDEKIIHNKSVGPDCTDGTHLFPDLLFERPEYLLIVEIDEHCHRRGSTYKCDQKRMYDIVAKVGLPTIFIRYNPDNKNSDKEKLLERVKFYLEHGKSQFDINSGGLKVEYLYYNQLPPELPLFGTNEQNPEEYDEYDPYEFNDEQINEDNNEPQVVELTDQDLIDLGLMDAPTVEITDQDFIDLGLIDDPTVDPQIVEITEQDFIDLGLVD